MCLFLRTEKEGVRCTTNAMRTGLDNEQTENSRRTSLRSVEALHLQVPFFSKRLAAVLAREGALTQVHSANVFVAIGTLRKGKAADIAFEGPVL